MKHLAHFVLVGALLCGCTAYDASGTVGWIKPPEHDWRVRIGGRSYGFVGVESATFIWCGRTYYSVSIPLPALLALVGAVGAVAVFSCVRWRRRHT